MSSTPVQPKQRIQYLDVIRGFAISGVLLAYVFWNLGNAPAGEYSSFDKIIDEIFTFLVDSKCYTLLATMFTVGFVLHMNKSGDPSRNLYVYRRRLFGLILIGVLHAVILRNGDILVPYAVLTLLVSLFYNASTKTIVILMVSVFLLEITITQIWQSFGLSFPQRPVSRGESYWEENFEWVKYWYSTAVFLWESTLLLLLGGLLVGRAFIQNKVRPGNRWLLVIMIAGLAAGYGSHWVLDNYRNAIINLPDIWGTHLLRRTILMLLGMIHRVGMAAAYASIFYLLAKRFSMGILANLGRMSLTNYILQALIVVPVALLLHLFDHITPTTALIMFMVIWVVQVLFCNWWLKRHQFGPLEWALRRFTYGKTLKPKEMKSGLVAGSLS